MELIVYVLLKQLQLVEVSFRTIIITTFISCEKNKIQFLNAIFALSPSVLLRLSSKILLLSLLLSFLAPAYAVEVMFSLCVCVCVCVCVSVRAITFEGVPIETLVVVVVAVVIIITIVIVICRLGLFFMG